MHVFVGARAAGGAAAVVDDYVVVPLLLPTLTVFCGRVMGKTHKGDARGSDVGEGEGRVLAMEGGGGEEEVGRAEDWVGVEM